MKQRKSGILLHITSLPSVYGIGDFGPGAYEFVDFIAQAKQGFWQILPLGAINSAFNPSPYHSISAFAYNKFLLSPELMIQEGLLNKSEAQPLPDFPQGRVEFKTVIPYKEELFQKAYERFRKKKNKDEYHKFCSENSSWLEDFALFVALKKRFRRLEWSDWAPEIRDRKQDEIRSSKKVLHDELEREKYFQYLCFQQWDSLRRYCHKKGIKIIGDVPIYVIHDSVDCWTHPEIFKLDKKRKPGAVSGVPPDYFSKTGQLWGNPVYRWDILKKNGYDWWFQRIKHSLSLYDMVRLDHFRGFVSYWEVPARERTAVKGRWVKAPAYDFFRRLKKSIPQLAIIAEDLGFITTEVIEVMKHFAFPGMKVLLFAFGKDQPRHPYLPHTYEKDCVAYTGTHDNNTIRGWFEREAKPEEKRRVFRYLGRRVSESEIHWEFIRLIMMSVANLAIFPMQDVLGLGEKARMNRPATNVGNWQWRLLVEHLRLELAKKLGEIAKTYGRT